MATITGLTAARMVAIEADSVIDGDVVGGNLILTKHDGSIINAGSVVGPQGIQGETGPAGLNGGPLPIVINSKTASYALILTDKYKLIEVSNGGATTITVPTNATQAFAIGDTVSIMQTGVGQVTVVGASGVTVTASPGLKLGGQWAIATLLKRGTDSWVLMGNLSA